MALVRFQSDDILFPAMMWLIENTPCICSCSSHLCPNTWWPQQSEGLATPDLAERRWTEGIHFDALLRHRSCSGCQWDVLRGRKTFPLKLPWWRKRVSLTGSGVLRVQTRRFPQRSPASTSPPAGSERSWGFHSQQCKLSFVKWPSPSHLVLLQLVLVGVLALAFPPQLLQLWVGSVKRVLLHLVLHLVPLKGGLKQREFTAVYSTRHLVTFHYTQKL